MEQIGGIILAGGKSSRMGKDKAFISNQGKMLINYSLELVQNFCDPVLISANSSAYDSFNLPIIKDEFTGYGPIAGIYSSLKHAENNWNFVISCDTPLVSEEVVRRLIANLGDYNCVVPTHNGHYEPLVALYNKSSLIKMELSIQNGIFKMKVLMDRLKTKFVDVSDLVGNDPDLFRNINSPKDMDY